MNRRQKTTMKYFDYNPEISWKNYLEMKVSSVQNKLDKTLDLVEVFNLFKRRQQKETTKGWFK